MKRKVWGKPGLLAVLPAVVLAALMPCKAQQTTGGPGDFDFLTGKWKVHFRVLITRLSTSQKWVDYDGTEECIKLLDTPVGFEEFDAFSPQLQMRNKGKTIRLYNARTHQWSLYQINNEGSLDEPVVGQFNGNRGEFTGHDTYDGVAILVRNIWINISSRKAHWEQAWSKDGGKTWETNWTSDLSRD